MFEIGLYHFLIVSFLLLAAGIATMLTKRNAIGILIGVELVLNAASINFVAFNHYGWPGENMPRQVVVAQVHPDVMTSTVTDPATTQPSATDTKAVSIKPQTVWTPAIDGQMFSIFIIVLAAAEAAIALAIFLNFYNNFNSIDVERADGLKG